MPFCTESILSLDKLLHIYYRDAREILKSWRMQWRFPDKICWLTHFNTSNSGISTHNAIPSNKQNMNHISTDNKGVENKTKISKRLTCRTLKAFLSTNQQDWCIGLGSSPNTLPQPLLLLLENSDFCQTRDLVILANLSVGRGKNNSRRWISIVFILRPCCTVILPRVYVCYLILINLCTKCYLMTIIGCHKVSSHSHRLHAIKNEVLFKFW